MTDTAHLIADFTGKNIPGDRGLFLKNEIFILDCIRERQKTFLVVSWHPENGRGILIAIL